MAIPLTLRNLRQRETNIFTRFPALNRTLEAATLFAAAAFFIFYGLVPVFGGATLGLVGADEPRYAQVAREMLARNDFITPILYGQPWLEKPALYYWRAMFSFREFGVHDWSARLPSASFAFVLITLIYLHIRRFRPGGQLDAALITVTCVGIIGFARGASTDMQLAAPFCIGMLGWYAWYETGSKFWLFDLYFFVGAATLAKGPVAPFMAIVIIFIFVALRREWSLLRRSVWVPGIVLYLAMVLPWFIAVQHRNPEFLRVFFLEHNLKRFATNLYQHKQPFWFYIPVTLLALMPWAALAVTAFTDGVRDSIAEWSVRRARHRYIGHGRAGDAFPEFLVIWALLPIVFFSFSKSKLPGYILPSIPPLTILTGDYLRRVRHRGLAPWLLWTHAALAGIMTALVLLFPRHVEYPVGLPPARALIAAGIVGLSTMALIILTVMRFGVERLRIATMAPMVVLLLFVIGVGPFFGLGPIPGTKITANLLNETYSARPLAQQLESILPPGETLAVYKVRRDMEYGLSFYRNHQVVNYEGDDQYGGQNPADTPVDTDAQSPAQPETRSETQALTIPATHLTIPDERHILVVRASYTNDLRQLLKGRNYQPLFTYPAQNLVIYLVSARP
ncbi:MAG TPA: glycosyltransferase family 39 protein [Acidisarcina sp.]